MRIPRTHRLPAPDGADALFRKLPAGARFRFASGQDRPGVFGTDPVAWTGNPGAPPGVHRLRAQLPRVPPARGDGLFPGGAVGYLSYEAGYALEGLEPRPPARQDPPDAWFAVYDTFAIWRPPEGVEVVSWGLTEDGRFDERLALQRAGALEDRLRGSAPAPSPVPAPRRVHASLTSVDHARAVQTILEHIARGDIYQADLTVRFEAHLEGDGVPLFEALVRDNPAPHAAFLETPDVTVVSSSPERLLRVQGDRAETRPIKGTAARSSDTVTDRARGAALLRSAKDRAELLMITDLSRNDLGKVCRFGSVRVPRLRELESFPHVHHLVSTVTGRLRPGLDAIDALDALFPAGSITGAPKRRAMEILRELEPTRRGVYTGTVGWLGFDRTADFNVAIRTGHLKDGVFSFGAGGGIVADSDPAAEWDELLLKARGFRHALGLREPAPLEVKP